METIDSTILEKGYSIFKSTGGNYYAISAKEIKRIHEASDGKPYKDLADTIKLTVCELVIQADKKIVLLNEDEISLQANLLTPVPIKVI